MNFARIDVWGRGWLRLRRVSQEERQGRKRGDETQQRQVPTSLRPHYFRWSAERCPLMYPLAGSVPSPAIPGVTHGQDTVCLRTVAADALFPSPLRLRREQRGVSSRAGMPPGEIENCRQAQAQGAAGEARAGRTGLWLRSGEPGKVAARAVD